MISIHSESEYAPIARIIAFSFSVSAVTAFFYIIAHRREKTGNFSAIFHNKLKEFPVLFLQKQKKVL
jgi:hypothetical protein